MSLTADEILNADDIKVELVDMPEWGGEVYVRTISGSSRDRFEATVTQNGQKGNSHLHDIRARFCSIVLSDEKGKQLFDAMNIQALSAKSADALQRVMDAGLALNGMDPDGIEKAEKNSETGPND